MHNDGVSYHQPTITDQLQIAARHWRRHVTKIDRRGLRKLVLAAMFITVALVYIGQLAMWGIFIPITPEGAQFTGTPLSTLAAAIAGVVYLWRVGVPHPIEITFIAIICAHFVQQAMVPVIYTWEIAQGDLWIYFAYAMYFAALLAGYCLSYIFFTGWRAPYRYKLIVAIIFVVATFVAQNIVRLEV